jgi:hypothetical protein
LLEFIEIAIPKKTYSDLRYVNQGKGTTTYVVKNWIAVLKKIF